MPDQPAAPWQGLRDEVEADVRRVSERLRTLSSTRLASPPGPSPDGGPGHRSRAAAGRAVAQLLADAAAALEATGTGAAPHLRTLPVLPDLAVGDQVAVTGHDLLAALAVADPPLAAQRAVQEACLALADVRRRL